MLSEINPKIKFILLLLVILFLSVLFIERPQTNYPSSTDAYYMMKKFVEQKLKAPSTAKFQKINSIQINQLSDYKWEFIGYVDAENSFGAKLRAHFVCVIRNEPDTKNWELENLTFGGADSTP